MIGAMRRAWASLTRAAKAEEREVAAINARFAAMDQAVQTFAETCEICAGVVYLCPDCRRKITVHTHENDYMCDCPDPTQGPSSSMESSPLRDVDTIREHDGARISGYGWPGPMRVLQ